MHTTPSEYGQSMPGEPASPPHGDGASGPTIVGIGASAGGLAALRRLFSSMPANPGVAFVVVMHLSPSHQSHLTEVLQPHCAMPVQQVSESVPLEPNRVYVIPPNANLETIDTHLRLSELEQQRRERAPIDHFFRTLAETHDSSAIGVVLTGTGSDGTLGLRWIKQKGGVTIAQSPAEAEYDGMPRNAIASGLVDLVLTLEEMPEHILKIARVRPRVSVQDARDGDDDLDRAVQMILALVRSRTGHDLGSYKRSTVLRRIRRRMQLREIEVMQEYLDFLQLHGDEVGKLFDDLLITVTEFFRDAEVFDRLAEDVIPRLLSRRPDAEALRIWSVGCSTGEEAYSLAILLLEEAARRGAEPRFQIFATDLHGASLVAAREGLYPGSIASVISPERLHAFFTEEQDAYRVRKEVRERVIFAPHDLLRDPPFSHLDLITCRNVLIYLQRSVQLDVFAMFHYALRQDGLLLLGRSESAEQSELFQCEDKRACLFRRRTVPARQTRLPLLATGLAGARPDPRSPPADQPLSYGALHARMVERYAPPSILVNDRHDIVHYSAHAGEFLRVPGGERTDNVFKLVREPLRLDLRAALHAAAEGRRMYRTKPVEIELEGVRRRVVIRVRPAADPDLEGFFLVIFDEAEEPRDASERGPDEVAGATVADLEAELDLSRQRLQGIIEEYETTQEELQASNEELQSANEELRSTLEELETSKEELQSMNEELVTVNQENTHRVEELSQISSDLQNLLVSTEIATLFLDRRLRIVRFTPQVVDLFNIRATDQGRPLSDFTSRIGYPELDEDARCVLERLAPREREVQGERGRWFMTRVSPYRTADDRIEGVVLTLIDISARKSAEEALRKSEEQFRELVSQVKDYAIFRIDLDGRPLTWNEGVQRVLGYTEREFVGRDLTPEVFMPEDLQAGIPERELGQAAKEGAASNDRWLRRRNGERFYALGITSAIRDEHSSVTGFTKVMRDHTRLKLTEESLRESEERLRLAAEATGFGTYDYNPRTGTAILSDRLRELLRVHGDGPVRPEPILRRVIHPDDEGRLSELMGAWAGPDTAGRHEVEFRIRLEDSEVRWLRAAGHTIFAQDDGRRFPVRVVGTVLDITDLKRHEEQMRFVMAELNHRVKNTLAVVEAIAEQTFRHATHPEAFMVSFSERLRSLSKAHHLLTRSEWTGAWLEDLVRIELESRVQRPEQLRLDGPALMIRPDAAMALHMVIHELSTNAAKYGALSSSAGRVSVRWTLEPTDDGEMLVIGWAEDGGPPCEPPTRSGFGTKVLERTVSYQLEGGFTTEYRPEGMRCTIRIPWTAEAAAMA
ncbi:MAG TPA: chemotaxis protein CheB [Phycisphaerales bacterium]|nr:chemotaxis protein CheB [Phycisphaerales bacterium]